MVAAAVYNNDFVKTNEREKKVVISYAQTQAFDAILWNCHGAVVLEDCKFFLTTQDAERGRDRIFYHVIRNNKNSLSMIFLAPNDPDTQLSTWWTHCQLIWLPLCGVCV